MKRRLLLSKIKDRILFCQRNNINEDEIKQLEIVYNRTKEYSDELLKNENIIDIFKKGKDINLSDLDCNYIKEHILKENNNIFFFRKDVKLYRELINPYLGKDYHPFLILDVKEEEIYIIHLTTTNKYYKKLFKGTKMYKEVENQKLIENWKKEHPKEKQKQVYNRNPEY